MASLRIPVFAGLYVLLFGALGAEVPFLPYLFSTTGLSAALIGVVLMSGTAARMLIAPLVRLAADKFGVRLVLGLSAIGAAVSFSLFLMVSGGDWHAVVVNMQFAMATAALKPFSAALSVPACLNTGVLLRSRTRLARRISGLTSFEHTLTARYSIWSIVPTVAALFALVAATLPMLPRAYGAQAEDQRPDKEHFVSTPRGRWNYRSSSWPHSRARSVSH